MKTKQTIIIGPEMVRKALPPRNLEGHKGSFGHVAIVGGAHGMLGAPILAAGGALRGGAGLVTVCGVEDLMLPLAANYPAAMIKPYKTENGRLGPAQAEAVLEFVKDKYPVCGMGMGRAEETMEFSSILFTCPCKGRVLDADALHALARYGKGLGEAGVNTILTPHPLEMAVLLDCELKKVQENRLWAVQAAAEKYQCVAILKGHRTLVAADGEVYENPTGNPGMGTGGSGDVLAGLVGAILAQGVSAKLAACAGVYLHGLSGDLAAADLTEQGLTASDLISYLPMALVKCLRD